MVDYQSQKWQFAKVIQIRSYVAIMLDNESEIFYVENLVAFCQHLISLSAQVELFTNVAHIKEFLAVFLEEQWSDIEVGGGNGYE